VRRLRKLRRGLYFPDRELQWSRRVKIVASVSTSRRRVSVLYQEKTRIGESKKLGQEIAQANVVPWRLRELECVSEPTVMFCSKNTTEGH